MLPLAMLSLSKLWSPRQVVRNSGRSQQKADCAHKTALPVRAAAHTAAPPAAKYAVSNQILPAADLIRAKRDEGWLLEDPAVKQLQVELQLPDKETVKDVFGAMVLSEVIQKLSSALPLNPGIYNVTWSPAGQKQKYIMAETQDALHVSFLGTKLGSDHITNFNLRYHPMPLAAAGTASTAAGQQQQQQHSGSGQAVSEEEEGSPGGLGRLVDWDGVLQGPLLEGSLDGPAAHRGYALRAAAVPVEQMYRLAAVRGKRLVLSGHSLGGAVATLSAIRLLSTLPQYLHSTVACIGFATPPVGNQALADAVELAGWDECIANYVLPEDWLVPGALGLWARTRQPAAAAATSGSHPTTATAHDWVCWGLRAPAFATTAL
ncbi:hypothetical protein N2152v2_000357 [Parachlorella kessleri]